MPIAARTISNPGDLVWVVGTGVAVGGTTVGVAVTAAEVVGVAVTTAVVVGIGVAAAWLPPMT